MPRNVQSAMLTDLAATNAAALLLIELDLASGTQYLTNAPVNISWNSQTWVAVGGAIGVAGTQERWEPGSSCRLSLSGVDQSILSAILATESRGRRCKVWWAHYDQAAGTILADPLLLFDGLLNDAIDITESHDQATGAGTVDIATRISERVSDVGRQRGIRTNVHSHQASGIPGAAPTNPLDWKTGDTFFMNTSAIVGTRIFWATEQPFAGTVPPVPPTQIGNPETRVPSSPSQGPGWFGVPTTPTTGGAGFGHDPTRKQG